MGFFGNLIGSADNSVLQNGILGRGEITNLTMSGMTLQTGNGLVERKCTITANVFIDNTPMFVATIVQRVQEIVIPQLSSGSAHITPEPGLAPRVRNEPMSTQATATWKGSSHAP